MLELACVNTNHRVYTSPTAEGTEMPYVEVTYKRNVSRRIVKVIVNTLYARACHRDLIPSESLDVYARKLNKLDRQQKLIMVRIHADPQDYMRNREDISRIEQEIWSILTELVIPTQVGVEIITIPAAFQGHHNPI